MSALESEIAAEFVQPAYTQDGGCGVAFFGADGGQLWVIPTGTDDEAEELARRFQALFIEAIGRAFKRRPPSPPQFEFEAEPLDAVGVSSTSSTGKASVGFRR